MEGREVSQGRYAEVIGRNLDRTFLLELDGVRVGLLHASLRLTLLHPDVQVMSDDLLELLNEVKDWTKEKLEEMGFSKEEVEYLDSELT